jgi:hypothetical protein
MCNFISFFHHPETGEIKVADLNSHGETEKHLKLNPAGPYREGHYTPDGEIELRITYDDKERGIVQKNIEEKLRQKFPSFWDFLRWCLKEMGQEKIFGGHLDLGSLTSLPEGVKLPKNTYAPKLKT